MIEHAAPRDAQERGDAELAFAARVDRRAFIALYDRYAERVERYVLARVGNRHDAEDVVSVAFMQALAKIDSYNPGRGTFAAWLFAIARNAINMHYRSRPLPAGDERTEDLVSMDGTPEDSALENERWSEMHAAMRELTVDQREAIALRYLGELSFAEVAQQLDKSEEAAKMLVRRGIETLRRRLQAREHC